MISVSLNVTLNEWTQAQSDVGAMAGRIHASMSRELNKVGEAAVSVFQKKALSGGFGQRQGSAALVNTGNYVNSWRVERVSGLQIGMGPTGFNRTMSNAALGELLEYGTAGMAGVPHMRGIMRWIERVGTKQLGEAVARGVFGSA